MTPFLPMTANLRRPGALGSTRRRTFVMPAIPAGVRYEKFVPPAFAFHPVPVVDEKAPGGTVTSRTLPVPLAPSISRRMPLVTGSSGGVVGRPLTTPLNTSRSCPGGRLKPLRTSFAFGAIILNDERSAIADVIEQALIVGAKIGTDIPRPNSGYDGVKPRQISVG